MAKKNTENSTQKKTTAKSKDPLVSTRKKVGIAIYFTFLFTLAGVIGLQIWLAPTFADPLAPENSPYNTTVNDNERDKNAQDKVNSYNSTEDANTTRNTDTPKVYGTTEDNSTTEGAGTTGYSTTHSADAQPTTTHNTTDFLSTPDDSTSDYVTKTPSENSANTAFQNSTSVASSDFANPDIDPSSYKTNDSHSITPNSNTTTLRAEDEFGQSSQTQPLLLYPIDENSDDHYVAVPF